MIISEKEPLKLSSGFEEEMFLGGEFGNGIHNKVLEKYGKFLAIRSVDSYYGENGNDLVIKGSTPFYLVAVNEFLPEGYRTATYTDLEKILVNGKLSLKGYWEESDLVWRSKDGELNGYLARDMFRQFQKRGIELKNGSAYLIPLFTLKLKEEKNSISGLGFNITDSTIENFIEAPILNNSGWFYYFDSINEETLLPKKLIEKFGGKEKIENAREIRIENTGLSFMSLEEDLNLRSDKDWSDDSHRGRDFYKGRVVIVKNKKIEKESAVSQSEIRVHDKSGITIEENVDFWTIPGVQYNNRICEVDLAMFPLNRGEVMDQDEWIPFSREARKKGEFYTGSMPQHHALFTAIYKMDDSYIKDDIKEFLNSYMKVSYGLITLTRIHYQPKGASKDIIIHNVGMPNEYSTKENLVLGRGSPDPKHIKEIKPSIFKAILEDDDLKQINNVYRWITGEDPSLIRYHSRSKEICQEAARFEIFFEETDPKISCRCTDDDGFEHGVSLGMRFRV